MLQSFKFTDYKMDNNNIGSPERLQANIEMSQDPESKIITLKFDYLNPDGIWTFTPKDGKLEVRNKGDIGFNNIGYTGYYEKDNQYVRHKDAFRHLEDITFEVLAEAIQDLLRCANLDMNFRGVVSGKFVHKTTGETKVIVNPLLS